MMNSHKNDCVMLVFQTQKEKFSRTFITLFFCGMNVNGSDALKMRKKHHKVSKQVHMTHENLYCIIADIQQCILKLEYKSCNKGGD